MSTHRVPSAQSPLPFSLLTSHRQLTHHHPRTHARHARELHARSALQEAPSHPAGSSCIAIGTAPQTQAINPTHSRAREREGRQRRALPYSSRTVSRGNLHTSRFACACAYLPRRELLSLLRSSSCKARHSVGCLHMHYEFKAVGRAGGPPTGNCPRHRAGRRSWCDERIYS
jgi:hypothetical protein